MAKKNIAPVYQSKKIIWEPPTNCETCPFSKKTEYAGLFLCEYSVVPVQNCLVRKISCYYRKTHEVVKPEKDKDNKTKI